MRTSEFTVSSPSGTSYCPHGVLNLILLLEDYSQAVETFKKLACGVFQNSEENCFNAESQKKNTSKK